jgi:hypothetical protein
MIQYGEQTQAGQRVDRKIKARDSSPKHRSNLTEMKQHKLSFIRTKFVPKLRLATNVCELEGNYFSEATVFYLF